jgi:bacterial/archaeal transporter family-2 protein
MSKTLLLLVTLIMGALLPIQAALNGKLMRTFGHPVIGATISFLTGTIILLIYAFSIRSSFNTSLIRETHWYHWTGGLIGALYVTGIIVLIPRLGAGLAFALIVSGQLIMSLMMDHYGFLGVPVNPVNPSKLIGIGLLIAGVLLIRGK